MRAAGVLVLAAFLLPEAGAAEPVLSYDPPAGWARGPYRSPVVFTAPGNDAELHIYGFQRYEGDVRQRFRQTRLFELIGIEHRESGTLQPPQFAEVQVQGAGAAPLATFVAQQGGANRLHLRIAIPQPGAVALVDFSVRSQDAWNRFLPEVDRVVASMRVGDSPAPAAATAPAARPAQGVSGLYLATVRRMVFRPSFSGGTGSSEWTTTTEYYLLSPEGKAYRGYGLPEVPGGDLRRFDFERARRADPGNSGTYAASGTRVTFILGAERLSGTLAGADELEIRGTKFRRSAR